jgi:hypothetical protein
MWFVYPFSHVRAFLLLPHSSAATPNERFLFFSSRTNASAQKTTKNAEKNPAPRATPSARSFPPFPTRPPGPPQK